MSAVIIRYSLEVVSDEAVKELIGATVGAGDDRVEVPGLPGITFQQITGKSRGYNPLDIGRLGDEIAVATKGEPPTGVILVRVGSIP